MPNLFSQYNVLKHKLSSITLYSHPYIYFAAYNTFSDMLLPRYRTCALENSKNKMQGKIKKDQFEKPKAESN